jgi:hypothetical protein
MATSQRGSNKRASSSEQHGRVIGAAPGIAASAPSASLPGQSTREQRIAVSAYLRAAERGFTPGHELEDWLAAERELEANGDSGSTSQRQ